MLRRPDVSATQGDPPRRLEGLDGLRGLAALSVLAYHVGLASGLTRFGALAPVIAQLKAGVAIFFVISGCVLWLPYARALSGGDNLPNARRFVERRARRIMPAYWLALSALALLPWGGVLGLQAWRYYALGQIYHADTLMGGLGVAWSLCVEVSFYAAVPILALLLRGLAGRATGRVSPSAQLVLLAFIALGSLLWRLALTGAPFVDTPHRGFVVMTALPGCADWFALGMAIAVLAAAWPPDGGTLAPARTFLARRWGAGSVAGALMVAAVVSEPRDLFLALYNPAAHLEVGLAGALIVASAALAPHVGARAAWRAPIHAAGRWLGEISYGIYLWHVIVLEVVLGGPSGAPAGAQSPLHAVVLLIATSAGAIACAALSWYGLERPLLRAGAARRALVAPSAA